MVFASRDVHFSRPDASAGPRLESYRLDDVRVTSLAVEADSMELWSDPAGLTLQFAGDNGSAHGLGGYFAFVAGASHDGRSVLLNYDSFPGLTQDQANAGGDTLGNVLLLAQQFAPGTYRAEGAWGTLAGPLILKVLAIPEPSVIVAAVIGVVCVAARMSAAGPACLSAKSTCGC
jgi:hypothetical protein